MKIVGLTGGIASGKSTVASVLAENGALIIDADEVAREVTRVGTGVYNSIIKEFGDKVLCGDGTINRKNLGAIVFSDPEKIKVLNRLTHGPIIAKIKNRVKMLRSTVPADSVVVIEAPLLIETGLTSLVDLVVVVTTDEEKQKERLAALGFSSEETMGRIGAQVQPEERQRFANYVIENNGTLDELKAKALELWANIKNK